MSMSELNANDVMEENGLNEYEAGMQFFYSELVDLNTILYLAEKIVQFPFDLFAHRDNTIFFDMVMRSFHDSVLLITTRLVTDQAGDLFTLLRFKNKIRALIRT